MASKIYRVAESKHITKDEYKMMKQCNKDAVSITGKTIAMCKKSKTHYAYLLARVIIKLNRELDKEVHNEQRS